MSFCVGKPSSPVSSCPRPNNIMGLGEIAESLSQHELSEILRCPLCKTIPLPPIYMCSQGHHFCFPCRQKLTKCGVCKQKLGTSTLRHHGFEAIINLSKFHCVNADQGCSVVLKGELHPEHLKDCYFRPVLCNETDGKKCENRMVGFSEFKQHLMTTHDVANLDPELKLRNEHGDGHSPFCIPLTDLSPNTKYSSSSSLSQKLNMKTWVFQYDKKDFISRGRIENNTAYFWILLLGNELEASHYEAKAQFVISASGTNNDPRRKAIISWVFPVVSFRDNFSHVAQTGSCVAINLNVLKASGMSQLESGDASHQSLLYTFNITKIQK